MTRSRVLAQILVSLTVAQATVPVAFAQAGADSTKVQRRDTLESVVIRATRAPLAPAAARHVVTREEIRATSVGQDAPLALLSTPSMTAYSESGDFSGYSYVRLRGIDQTRLNITVDGVPLNDPEDQVLYFSNVPDFLGSMSTVEIGRGVGASTFGTASFAGSLNFQSMPLATTPRGGSVELSGGSYGPLKNTVENWRSSGTWRASMQGATGVDSHGFAAYGRFTRQGTDGYREHSGNDAWSGFGSAGWFGNGEALKLTAMAGLSGTRMAYLAAPESDLMLDRRTNPLTAAEGDRFHQEMVSLQYSRSILSGLDGTILLYRNSAAGAYDVNFGNAPDGSGPTFGNYGLSHVWQGVTSTFAWTAREWSLVLGGTASDYHRDHWLAERPDLSARDYTNTGVKREASSYLKASYLHGPWRFGADLQARYARFLYEPSANAGIHPQPVTWSFINPKFGVTWDDGGAISYFATTGRTWREPARGDLLAGADDLNAQNVNDILPFSQVHPEKVDDYEAGAVWRFARGSLTVNGFAMEFHNEIAPIGQLALTGAPLRKNVPRSYRRGVELDGSTTLPGGSTLSGNFTGMTARISEYDDKIAGVKYTDIAPLLTPPVTANLRWDTPVAGPVGLTLAARYVEAQHLANDGNDALIVPSYTMLDGGLRWVRGANTVRFALNNALNTNAYAAGYTDGTSRYLFPIATRNVMVTVRHDFGGFVSAAR